MTVTGAVELIGIEWTLLRLVSDGVESAPGNYPLEITLGITRGGTLSATDGCNWLGGSVEVQAGRLVAGGLASTARGCLGPVTQIAPVIRRVLMSNPTWAIQNATLTLTGANTTLMYEPRRSLFPSDRPGQTAPLLITQGRRGNADYRFRYATPTHGVQLHGQWRQEPGGAWSVFMNTLKHDWSGPEPNPMACDAMTIGTDLVIAGLVTEPTTRVTFRPVGGDEVDLDLYQLPEAPRHRVYIGFVGQPERGSTVHAYDASGVELGPAHAPHW